MAPASPLRAVLLAAGRGQRLAPLTDSIPKPLIALNGRPLLEYTLDNLAAVGCRQVLLVIGYRGDMIRQHFGDGHSIGLELSYVEQGAVAGTGAAALMAEDFVGSEPFVLGWGDILAAAAEYDQLFREFERLGPDAMLLLEAVDDPRQGAAVEMADGRILSLEEKPEHSTACWNQAGLSIYSPRIFAALKALPLSTRGEVELTAAVQQLIDDDLRVLGVPMLHPRLHLTQPDDIARVEQALSSDGRYRRRIAQSGRDG